MSKRVLIALVVILLIAVAGMVLTMKRSMEKGASARDPDIVTPAKTPPPKR